MKCYNCQKEIPDNSQFCNICGAKQIELKQSKLSKQILPIIEPKTKEKRKHIISIVTVIIIIVIIAFIPNLLRNQKYNKAISLIELGTYDNYMEGAEIFVSIKNKKYNEIFDYCKEFMKKSCEKDDTETADEFLTFLEHYKILSEEDSQYLSNYIDYWQAEKYIDSGKYTDAYYQYIRLGEYEDSADKALEVFENHKDAFYELAIENYEKGTEYDFEFAKSQFEKLGDYKESEKYLQKINVVQELQGVYASSSYKQGDRYFAVEGLKSYLYDSDGSIIVAYDLIVNTYNNNYCMVEKLSEDGYNNNIVYAFMYNEDGQPQRYEVKVNADNEIESVIKTLQIKTNNEQFKKEFNRIPPAIGMTAEEVKNSTWGEPIKINKSTYSWGTSEQWVYSGYKYVYLDNGVVTAIQE